jgi:hypothetical protein
MPRAPDQWFGAVALAEAKLHTLMARFSAHPVPRHIARLTRRVMTAG